MRASLVLSLLLLLSACASVPSSEPSATLEGTVTYLPRIALPPEATVTVRLEDVSRADAPAPTLADTQFQTSGAQVPLPYRLTYDLADINPRHQYVVRAEIRRNGELLWTTDTHIPVLTHGAPSDGVEIRLVQVASSSPPPRTAAPLVGPTWSFTRLDTPEGGTRVPEVDDTNTITFTEEGRYSGQAACNRYGGTYTADDSVTPATLSLSSAATTLAGCLTPSMASTYLSALAETESYALNGSALRLTTSDGRVLTFEQAAVEGMSPQETGRTFTFTCAPPDDDAFQFTIKTGPGEIGLWLPERFDARYLVLGQVRAASGAKYQDGDVVVWTRGDEALLEMDGQRFPSCRAGE